MKKISYFNPVPQHAQVVKSPHYHPQPNKPGKGHEPNKPGKGYVRDETAIILKPSTPEVTEFGSQIVGIADPFVTIITTYNDQQYQTNADAQGSWSLNNPISGAGSVTIVAVNAKGIVSLEIGLAQIAPLPPSIPVFSQEGDYLVGTADPHVTVVVRHNGVEYNTEADVNGQWTLLNPMVPGTFIEVFARNEIGEESPSIISGMAPLPEIPVFPDWAPITPVILEQGEYLSGKATPHTQIIVTANGHEYSTSVDGQGNWSLLNPIAQGGTLEIYAVNDLGIRSNIIALAIPVVFPEPELPVIEPEQPSYILFELVVPTILENGEQLAGEAMPYGKIVILANNQEYMTYANANGEWSIENPIAQGGFLTLYSENAAGQRSETISLAKINFPLNVEQHASIEDILTTVIEQDEESASLENDSQDIQVDLTLLLQDTETPTTSVALIELIVLEVLEESFEAPYFADQNINSQLIQQQLFDQINIIG